MITINNLTKQYGDNILFKQANYTFPQTGVVCLMGASGGGKTTLLNLLAGFDTSYEGDILVGGTALNKMNTDELCAYRKDNIGFIFQNYHLLPGYTVLENVMLGCALINESYDTSYQKAKSLLSRLGISEKETHKIENLSGGQKQRVAIARALMSDPQILFADEPTGALDRTTSVEIMALLREVAQNRLVVIITHDPQICAFADEVVYIRDQSIIAEQPTKPDSAPISILIRNSPIKTSSFTRGLKNFKVHLKRYIAISLALAIGILSFLFSLSFGNIMKQSIETFKEKNTAFNNGYIKGRDDGTILDILSHDDRIENVYYQYILNEVRLSQGKNIQVISEKFPTPKATESLSYGVMPRQGMQEIALSPSLAKKFDADIQNLIGKEVTLTLNNQHHTLTISGIYNASYDDFFISSDVERQLYTTLPKQANYAISYDVKEFSDIVTVSNDLRLRGLDSKNASTEVNAFQNTFNSLNNLFFIISLMIFVIGLFICMLLLFKLQNTRYHEVGLLAALGFSRQQIISMIFAENMLLSILATVVTFTLLGCSMLLSNLLHLPLMITSLQFVLSMIITFVIIIVISGMASYTLVHTEPAIALRT